MPIDPVLPHDLDDIYGPGAEEAMSEADRQYEIFELITNERERQDKKWGPLPRSLPDVIWLTVLIEEVGEIGQAILKQDWDNLRTEIVQVAAVAVAWLEDKENHDNGQYKVG